MQGARSDKKEVASFAFRPWGRFIFFNIFCDKRLLYSTFRNFVWQELI